MQSAVGSEIRLLPTFLLRIEFRFRKLQSKIRNPQDSTPMTGFIWLSSTSTYSQATID